MNKRQLEQRSRGKIHHFARFTLRGGETKEGYMQPFDEDFVYLTAQDGTSAGKIALDEIINVEFPNG